MWPNFLVLILRLFYAVHSQSSMLCSSRPHRCLSRFPLGLPDVCAMSRVLMTSRGWRVQTSEPRWQTQAGIPGSTTGWHCAKTQFVEWQAKGNSILSIIFNHFSTIRFLPILSTTATNFPTALHQVASQQLSEGTNFQAHRCLDTFTGYCKSRFPTLQDTVHRFTHSWVHHSSTSRTTTRQ